LQSEIDLLKVFYFTSFMFLSVLRIVNCVFVMCFFLYSIDFRPPKKSIESFIAVVHKVVYVWYYFPLLYDAENNEFFFFTSL
jgi:hypothetical protein